jgi:hypothetical protein
MPALKRLFLTVLIIYYGRGIRPVYPFSIKTMPMSGFVPKSKMPPASRIFSQQSEVAGGIKLSGFRLVLKFFILFPETFNTTRCVNQFLFAGKKRMAFGAYFNADIGPGRTDLYLVAARTPYAGISVIRMNAVFHDFFNPRKLIDLRLSIED